MPFSVPSFNANPAKVITDCQWLYKDTAGELSDKLELRKPLTKTMVPINKVSQQLIVSWVEDQLGYTEKELKDLITYNAEQKRRNAYQSGPYVPGPGDTYFVKEGDPSAQPIVPDDAKEAVKTKVKEKAKETVEKVAEKVKEVVENNQPIVPIPAPEDDPHLGEDRLDSTGLGS